MAADYFFTIIAVSLMHRSVPGFDYSLIQFLDWLKTLMRALQRIAEPAAGVLRMTDSKATCVQALGTSLFSGARLKIESHHLDLVCLKLKKF